ncbi:hypothetical protein C0J52_04681 [Blattella germanica]|nr:hypothetical protein C0J52_04681 [Blattella germanica]
MVCYFCSRHLFSLIKKHQDTWTQVVNMDKQLYNPERLFQNRGAQLLQEEKARKAAQKDLPKLEELIKIETKSFEKENGRPFYVFGKRFSEMILHQKEEHKENQKSLRIAQENSVQQNGSSLKKIISSCSSSKKCGETAAPTHPNPVKATTVSKLKRKLNRTPSPACGTTHSKMARIATYDQMPSKFARPLNARHRLDAVFKQPRPHKRDAVFKQPRPHKREELIACVQEEWNSVTPEETAVLAESFGRRVEECLHNQGCHIK